MNSVGIFDIHVCISRIFCHIYAYACLLYNISTTSINMYWSAHNFVYGCHIHCHMEFLKANNLHKDNEHRGLQYVIYII